MHITPAAAVASLSAALLWAYGPVHAEPLGGMPGTLPAGPAYADNADSVLAVLIEEALERNPAIREAELSSAAAWHRIPQATALPDPTVSLTVHGQPPETRVGPQRGGIAVQQALPWFGKRADRGAVARAQADVRDALVAARRAAVVREVKAAYYEMAYLDRAVAVAEQEADLLRLYETLAEARYAQGTGLQQSVVKLQAEGTRILSRRDALLQERVAAEAALNALRDRPAHVPLPAVRFRTRPETGIDEERLRELGRTHHPEVRAARLRMETERGNVRLARREPWPDIVVGAAWNPVGDRRDRAGRLAPPGDNGEDQFSLSIGVSIPLQRGRYAAGVREAAARLDAARAAFRRTVNGVDVAVRDAGARLTRIAARIRLHERALVPQAEQALRSAEAAYSAGTVDVLDLLDSEEMLLDARLALARLESDYMQALADMERAIGTAFPEVAS
ncbi:MAG: TolC family protein [Gammaproteobacteria bacterium]|nr:TolC family protein [Gammaproteobacteria bacterium]